MRSGSSSPKRPLSPAWGLSPATAMRGSATPKAMHDRCARSMTSPTRAGVTRRIASANETWVLTWTTRSVGPTSNMLTLSAPVRSVKQLGVARVVESGQVHGFLVERRGDDSVDGAGQGQIAGRHHIVDRGRAGGRTQATGRDLGRICVGAIQQGDHTRFVAPGRRIVDRIETQRALQTDPGSRSRQHPSVAHNHRAADLPDFLCH